MLRQWQVSYRRLIILVSEVEWPSILFLCRDLGVDWANWNRVGDTNVWVGGGVGGDAGACCVGGRYHTGA